MFLIFESLFLSFSYLSFSFVEFFYWIYWVVKFVWIKIYIIRKFLLIFLFLFKDKKNIFFFKFKVLYSNKSLVIYVLIVLYSISEEEKSF